MLKKVEPLQLRQSDDGSWEVENVTGHWIKCETKEDAELLSNAPIVRAKLDRTTCPDNALAAELDKAAEMLDKYNMGPTARYFRAMAEKARGKIP
jgi:hypothetical protein